MNPDPNEPGSPGSEAAEPKAARASVPVWLFVLFFLLLYWGMIYFDQRSAWADPQVYIPYHSAAELAVYQSRLEGPDISRGQLVFDRTCALCHGPDGRGKPGQAPPLAGSDWASAAGVNRLVRIPILGFTGPIQVNGQQYDFPTGMTPIAATRELMSDEDLANVLSFVRQAWGNKASPVTPEQVKIIRDRIGNRSTQLTAEELKGLPENM
ncbi:MAG TPA: cytochrome c [Candidatus Acidoferrum sp.]|jgi:mono/diheme cytochrome c family protein|nr:cytochrome c [Candidatus Acidoferrum sp.]